MGSILAALLVREFPVLDRIGGLVSKKSKYFQALSADFLQAQWCPGSEAREEGKLSMVMSLKRLISEL